KREKKRDQDGPHQIEDDQGSNEARGQEVPLEAPATRRGHGPPGYQDPRRSLKAACDASFAALRLFPVDVEFLQREVIVVRGDGPAAMPLANAAFDVTEALRELVDGPPEGRLGVDLCMAGEVHEREQNVAELGLDPVRVAVAHRAVELAELFVDLRPRSP